MTGQELLEQVRRIPEDYDDLCLDQLLPRFIVERIAALDGCVLLTAEEAETIVKGPATCSPSSPPKGATMTKYGDSGVFDPIPGDGYADLYRVKDDVALESGGTLKAGQLVRAFAEEGPMLGISWHDSDGHHSMAILRHRLESADDVGPPPPGADGDYPDPEIGLEC